MHFTLAISLPFVLYLTLLSFLILHSSNALSSPPLGSMMVDELVGMRVALAHKLEEAEEALKVLLAEHDLARQSTLNMYRSGHSLLTTLLCVI